MFFARIFLPFAIGYFISHLFRSVNAVVSANLITDFALNAWTVGFLTSTYFLTFTVAQLPIGIALDRFGPRRTECVLLLFTAIGALIFALANSIGQLSLGRALIGFGVASCLMASFHAFAIWSPQARLPFLNGAVMAVGALGSVAATIPVAWTVETIGWRQLFFLLSATTLFIAVIIYFLVPEKEQPQNRLRLRETVSGMQYIFKSKLFWSVLPFSVAHQGSYIAIQSLWAGPWLSDVAGLDSSLVASNLLTLSLAMGVGFLMFGYLAKQLSHHGISTLSVWVCAAILFQGVQTGLTFEWINSPRILWLLFGLFGAAGMLGYVTLTQRFPLEMAGRVNTSLNVFVFAGAFAFQSAIGGIIQMFTPVNNDFSPEGYSAAFKVVLCTQILALLWLLVTTSWRKETIDVPKIGSGANNNNFSTS